MTNSEHARIFYGYIARITPANLDDIYKARKEALHASLNLSLSSQLAAQDKLFNVIEKGIADILESDKNNLQRIIEIAYN